MWSSTSVAIREYTPTPTVSRFIRDESFIKGIMGPVGSGKSVGCCFALYDRLRQFDAAGLPSRWVVVRNTYRELEDTTMRTWFDWFPAAGKFKRQSLTHTIDLTQRHEVIFRALDRPQDVGKLLSLEVSGFWLNEVREIPKSIYDMSQTRIGRYPRRVSYGNNIPPFGLIMDSNPMDDFHWYYTLAEELRPDNAVFYRQPGGLDDDAENLDNLPPHYYTNIALGKDEAWVDVYVNGNYGFVLDGKPVYPAFKDRLHIADEPLKPIQGRGLVVGLDFGLTPAAVFMQQTATGQWQVIDELVTDDMAADQFGQLLGERIRSDWRGHDVEVWGDPAGDQRSQVDAQTPFMVLRAQGIQARPARSPSGNPNDFELRRQAVAQHLTRMDMAGEPGLVISPQCRYLRRAMAGGYKYRQLQVSGDERFNAEPEKNIYSHVAEALQYAMVGAGQAREFIGHTWDDKPIKPRRPVT